MSDQTPKPKQRRGFKVDGQEVAPRAKPRDLEQAFKLNRSEEELEAAAASGQVRYDPKRVEAFVAGYITLGDLEGITKPEQYEMAQVGHAHLVAGRLDKAETIFSGLMALDPFDPYFHLVLGSIAQQHGKLEDAEACYTRALKYNPFSASTLANRGEVRVQCGKLESGAEDLIKAVELDPGGKEQATLRARATLLVLKEQLAKLDSEELKLRAKEATDSKVKVAGRAPPRLLPRAGAPAKPNAARPGPGVGAPKKK
jgi:tetratricopeptide (TPR) repeat protein